jgi:hypothetical protein
LVFLFKGLLYSGFVLMCEVIAIWIFLFITQKCKKKINYIHWFHHV